jgi:protein TonB
VNLDLSNMRRLHTSLELPFIAAIVRSLLNWRWLLACIASALALAGTAAGATASDDGTTTTDQELATLLAEQKRLIEQTRRKMASLPPKRRAELAAVLAELERRVNEPARTRYVTATTKDPALHAYYSRFQHRLEEHGTANFPKDNGVSLYGRVIVVLTLQGNGKIETVEIAKSSSEQLAKHSIEMLRQLEPFEPFPADIAKTVDRIVITSSLNYSREE